MKILVEWVKSMSIVTLLSLGTLLRVILIGYSQYHDSTSEVKYTDIDYTVFTDAARHVNEGRSPFERHTYRYSPIIAYLLTPNIFLSPVFGKLIFVVFDILSGFLIFAVVRQQIGIDEGTARLSAAAWIFNPLVMNVSTRGSAESIIVALVLLTVFFYNEKLYVLCGLFYGLAIHMKIYPIIYCLALYAPLTDKSGLFSVFHLTKPRLRLVLSTVVTLIFFTGLFYHIYGDIFINEAYLYHITRKDIRHNFSVYFYMLYLTVEFDDIGLNILTFLPQVILLLALVYRKIFILIKSTMIRTIQGVSRNLTAVRRIKNSLGISKMWSASVVLSKNIFKVVTAQYFLWYFCLLPLVAPHLKLTNKEICLGAILWGFAQGSWLLPAYLLEFKGNNTFFFIWIESLAFFCANVGILAKLIRKHRERMERIEKACNIQKID
ncbi:GPI mannosyltransferase 1 [Eurytemora carolleeae]|uniref:GPI mannosyltransferase 1 n=1 Tax=Eurytemora carolleeae TaxID=1294199 RepID=UPI000C790A8B|nr:GPI mannosyltransferase 1 [Eurytemora carolleeae]|eukprot:XP_023339960.1 GPI mannosyltransferase 1-like [Eurytemora affinis]